MQLLVPNHFVSSVCKETLQTAEERVIITGTHFTNKLLNLKRRLDLIYVRIKRKQEADKTFFHFAIGETQAIHSKFFIIPLNGQVSTLINYRDGIGGFRIYTVQHLDIGLFMCHPLQVIMMFFQQFHQIGRRTRFKPITTKLLTLESVQQTERVVHAD